MTNPFVRTIGQVEDIDGIHLTVGVDYDTVVIEGYRFNPQQQEKFGRLFVAAVRQAGQQSRAMTEGADQVAAPTAAGQEE